MVNFISKVNTGSTTILRSALICPNLLHLYSFKWAKSRISLNQSGKTSSSPNHSRSKAPPPKSRTSPPTCAKPSPTTKSKSKCNSKHTLYCRSSKRNSKSSTRSTAPNNESSRRTTGTPSGAKSMTVPSQRKSPTWMRWRSTRLCSRIPWSVVCFTIIMRRSWKGWRLSTIISLCPIGRRWPCIWRIPMMRRSVRFLWLSCSRWRISWISGSKPTHKSSPAPVTQNPPPKPYKNPTSKPWS